MMRHVYSIVRYVPNTANGERVNIGVLAGSEATGEWALHAVTQRSRARRLGGSEKTRAAVFEYLKRLAAGLEACSARGGRHPGGCSEAWLRDLADRQLGVVQFSQPLPLEADSTESATPRTSCRSRSRDWTQRRYAACPNGSARSAPTTSLPYCRISLPSGP